jgi:hypothetical protein
MKSGFLMIGGRVRLKDIQNMLAKDFNIHYQDINGVHYLETFT